MSVLRSMVNEGFGVLNSRLSSLETTFRLHQEKLEPTLHVQSSLEVSLQQLQQQQSIVLGATVNLGTFKAAFDALPQLSSHLEEVEAKRQAQEAAGKVHTQALRAVPVYRGADFVGQKSFPVSVGPALATTPSVTSPLSSVMPGMTSMSLVTTVPPCETLAKELCKVVPQPHFSGG